MNNIAKNLLIWVGIIGLMMVLYFKVAQSHQEALTIPYSQFLADVKAGRVAEVKIHGNVIEGQVIEGRRADKSEFITNAPFDFKMVDDLIKYNVNFESKPEERSVLLSLLVNWFPMLLIFGVFIYFARQMQGGGKGGAFSFGKSRAKLLDDTTTPIMFADVAGCDEAKEEVSEIVDFLKDPTKFQRLGGRIPRGILLVGSPGTGKTLLARAIAGEAKVPFFSISGSDFVEMFVGVGASRVRDMFEQAKKNSPCIIFIDEIDAVGRQRGVGLGGGNDEREQTLNQMLVEMDGFEGDSGVIVVAATNRADVLDPALLRPGRFDRQVTVSLPDIRGREQILHVHMRKVPISADVRADVIARGTPGFSGADIANLVNEAALFAARRNKRLVDMSDFESAKDKIYMGPERRSMVLDEDDRRKTAYHESGHAVVAKLSPKADPVHKVTIMPRGGALGITWQLPERDQFSRYKDQMLTQIAILLGGRIAEEIFVDTMSTGASNDFERATKIARDMVIRYGMSDALGVMVYADTSPEGYYARPGMDPGLSEATKQNVDAEIRRILNVQYAAARKILEENRDKVEAMTQALMEWETIDADQINEIMAGLPPRPPMSSPPPNRPSDDVPPAASKIDTNEQPAVGM